MQAEPKELRFKVRRPDPKARRFSFSMRLPDPALAELKDLARQDDRPMWWMLSLAASDWLAWKKAGAHKAAELQARHPNSPKPLNFADYTYLTGYLRSRGLDEYQACRVLSELLLLLSTLATGERPQWYGPFYLPHPLHQHRALPEGAAPELAAGRPVSESVN
jgi:hypothetical protein